MHIHTTTCTFYLLLLAIATAFLFFSSCDLNSRSDPEPQHNILETAQNFNEFETFVQSVEDADLHSDFTDTGPLTVFQPTEQAFDKLPDEMRDTLSADQLAKILKYYAVEDEIYAGDLEERQALESVEGGELYIVLGDSVYVNDKTKIVAGNIQANNGILHAVDEVLSVYHIITKRYSLHPFEEPIQDAGLEPMLNEESQNEYTVFAAVEEAFENVNLPKNQQELEDLLTYHLVPEKLSSEDLEYGQTLETSNGEEIMVEKDDDTITSNGNASVTQTDLQGTNGVVHTIDTLLDPPTE